MHSTVEEEWKMLTDLINKAPKVEKIRYLGRRLGYKNGWTRNALEIKEKL